MATSAFDRLTVAVLESMGRRMWGFAPSIMPLVVDQMGAGSALVWFGGNFPRFLRTRSVLGPTRTHLACVTVSLLNKCAYCAYGHAYALELLYLKERGRLFPLDARTLSEWPAFPPRELAGKLRELLQDAGMHAEVRWVDRTIAIAARHEAPVDEHEVRLEHLVGMVTRMNQVASEGCAALDGAHDPVNKDVSVKEKHAQLRAASPSA